MHEKRVESLVAVPATEDLIAVAETVVEIYTIPSRCSRGDLEDWIEDDGEDLLTLAVGDHEWESYYDDDEDRVDQRRDLIERAAAWLEARGCQLAEVEDS